MESKLSWFPGGSASPAGLREVDVAQRMRIDPGDARPARDDGAAVAEEDGRSQIVEDGARPGVELGALVDGVRPARPVDEVVERGVGHARVVGSNRAVVYLKKDAIDIHDPGKPDQRRLEATVDDRAAQRRERELVDHAASPDARELTPE